MTLFISALVGALLSILLWPFLYPFTEDFAQTMVVKWLGKTHATKNMKLAGVWIQKWIVLDSKNFQKENEMEVKLHQFGKKIYGTVDPGVSPEKICGYKIFGKIDKGMYVTGTWEDSVDGSSYKGVFQLYIHKYATHMSGKWMGYSEKNEIKTGEWLWRRKEEKEYKSS
jgi:hypothetical protein